MDFIPIASINTFLFCKRRYYLEYILGFSTDNQYTIEGKNIESEDTYTDGKGRHVKRVYAVSYKYGIHGLIDIVLENKNELEIIEYKRGYRGNWYNDEMQVVAQMVALCETIGRNDIKTASVFYYHSKRKRKITLTDDKKRELENIVKEIRHINSNKKAPKPVLTNKCYGCSEREICLPEVI